MEACGILNLSNKNIRKIDESVTANVNLKSIISLNLSENSLQRLDNIDIFSELTELNASRNQLLRMYNLNKLHRLVKIDLSNNHIVSIEGLKELKNLKHLNLSHNNIKVLDNKHLQTNCLLEYLNLSHNSIALLTNIAYLTALKVLHLRKNQISNLRHCELYLPNNLEFLSVANNKIADLNEFSHLAQLYNLKELFISGNPCVAMTGENVGFDYRPFILNWCIGLRSIDGYAVNDIENLKAEWLYSQGKGRKFKVGEHSALVQYLVTVCPMSGEPLETVNDRKLRLILSKAQQHQKQLSQETSHTEALRSSTRRFTQNPPQNMTRSLDSQTLCRKTSIIASDNSLHEEFAERRMTRSAHWPESNRSDQFKGYSLRTVFTTDGEPLPTSTALVPAPDSLISPSIGASSSFYSTFSLSKSPEVVIEDTEAQREEAGEALGNSRKDTHSSNNANEAAATRIQKVWRGYRARVLNRRVLGVYQQIQALRFNQYVKKLALDMEATRAALDKEHQLQVLQMEAINALWKKISALQTSAEYNQTRSQMSIEKMNIKGLTYACNQLDSQIQKLQMSVQEIHGKIKPKLDIKNAAVMSTQTDIIAVHTPKDDNKLQFPYQKTTARPSSLPLATSNKPSHLYLSGSFSCANTIEQPQYDSVGIQKLQ